METLKCLIFLAFLAVVVPAIHAQDEQSGSNSLVTIPAVNDQDDQLGFISLDCGSPENYTDKTTGINYISDSSFIQSGTSHTISPSLFNTISVLQQLTNLRAFSQGTRNCYTLILPPNSTGNTCLIRASFLYGNYDSTSQLPSFDLHLGVEYWDSVTFSDAATPLTFEIIRILRLDYIDVCLVKTGSSTPFISSLELRVLSDNTYMTQLAGSLRLLRRYNFDTKTKLSVRYKDDLYDRIWSPHALSNVTTLSTDLNVSYNSYQVPSAVMGSLITPSNANESLQFYWDTTEMSEKYYIYLHFAEVVPLQTSQFRQFSIYLNNEIFFEDVVPIYLSAFTIYSTSALNGGNRHLFSLNKTANSTLPPIINAVEVYTFKEFLNMETNEASVSAMLKIKSMYGITKNWQGDPCLPRAFIWDGLNCSYNGSQGPIITSLNLSRSGINGEIAPSIANLTAIKYLDLSNNNLTGEVPDFLGRLPSLTTINLKGNNFTGSIPAQLLDKSRNGVLSLSFDDTGSGTNPCESASCKKKKNKILVPASVAAVSFVLCVVLATILYMIIWRKRQGRKVFGTNKNKGRLVTENRQFSYSQVLRITNNFEKVIGKGGFGTVYHGFVGDTQVAVKMLSPSSTQGYKEFQAEASLLMSVHHKNVSTLVGYCDEGTNMGIIYEYMANGNLDQHLSDKNLDALVWEERLRIATDAAHGLEYLHHGCKPPIIHRDVKLNNILLNEKFQAKLTDFGLSRAFPLESDTHVSTVVAGTPGYLDPEYFISNRLTEKSDVYGFGIVMLEIVTGRPAIAKDTERIHIVQWVTTTLINGDISDIVDPRLKIDFDINSAKKVMELAMSCASRVSSERPTMTEVVLELNACLSTYMALHQNEDASYEESSRLMTLNVQGALVSEDR